MEHCPVCPYASLDGSELACPSCATDLAALRRVQQLPLVILNDGVRLAKREQMQDAAVRFRAAALFPSARPRALAILDRHDGHPKRDLWTLIRIRANHARQWLSGERVDP